MVQTDQTARFQELFVARQLLYLCNLNPTDERLMTKWLLRWCLLVDNELPLTNRLRHDAQALARFVCANEGIHHDGQLPLRCAKNQFVRGRAKACGSTFVRTPHETLSKEWFLVDLKLGLSLKHTQYRQHHHTNQTSGFKWQPPQLTGNQVVGLLFPLFHRLFVFDHSVRLHQQWKGQTW